jgi:hypothetical protein
MSTGKPETQDFPKTVPFNRIEPNASPRGTWHGACP